MRQSGPRYPDRLFRLIAKLDDEELSLAEVTRRVGAAAAEEGLTRPSVPHVRALLSELRSKRAEEREIREATLTALQQVMTRNASPFGVVEAHLRATERVEERGRRRKHA